MKISRVVLKALEVLVLVVLAILSLFAALTPMASTGHKPEELG